MRRGICSESEKSARPRFEVNGTNGRQTALGDLAVRYDAFARHLNSHDDSFACHPDKSPPIHTKQPTQSVLGAVCRAKPHWWGPSACQEPDTAWEFGFVRYENCSSRPELFVRQCHGIASHSVNLAASVA